MWKEQKEASIERRNKIADQGYVVIERNDHLHVKRIQKINAERV